MPIFPWAKLALYALPVIALAGIFYAVYSIGSDSGKASVQAEWNIAKEAERLAIQKIKDDYAAREAAYRQVNRSISDELTKTNEQHSSAVAAISLGYEQRLRHSTERASIYQRQAEGGTAQCQRLASHAAELDRSLEQGIRLVKEYGATIEQRDGQLKALGAQILNDRQLLGDTDATSGK